jgi:hypothetical protein
VETLFEDDAAEHVVWKWRPASGSLVSERSARSEPPASEGRRDGRGREA